MKRPIDGPSTAAGAYVGAGCTALGRNAGVDWGFALAAGMLVGVVVAVATGHRTALWTGLGRRRLQVVPVAVPAVGALGLILADEYGHSGAVPLSVLAWLVAFVIVGSAFWAAVTNAYAAHAAGEVRTTWTANAGSVARRRRIGLTVLYGSGCVVAFVASALYGVPTVVPTAFAGATVSSWIAIDRTRVYEACEGGLRYTDAGASVTQFVPWSRFGEIRETDDAVVLERRWWLDERMADGDVPPNAREALREGLRADHSSSAATRSEWGRESDW
ncbi:hypothetical protein [Natronolimnohabitans innermongolicus]|nr:hypothetical protein [Natronolimnohabitans innermongolicus]